MSLILPEGLPAIESLKEENIFIEDGAQTEDRSTRKLRIALLNIMPIKETTEKDFARVLSYSPLDIELTLMKLRTHTPKHASPHNLLAEDAELLCRQLVLRHSVMIVESGLCRPTDVERALYVGVSPSEYLRKFLPVAHVLKLKMFYRRTRHDESVELLVLQFVEIGVDGGERNEYCICT